jgi:hypothetical protein
MIFERFVMRANEECLDDDSQLLEVEESVGGRFKELWVAWMWIILVGDEEESFRSCLRCTEMQTSV